VLGGILALQDRHPLPPTNSQEYQNEGFTKFAFHKRLILRGMFLVEQDRQELKSLLGKRKAGAGSRSQNIVFPNCYCTKGITKVKENLRSI
jgi:hypothetical protein